VGVIHPAAVLVHPAVEEEAILPGLPVEVPVHHPAAAAAVVPVQVVAAVEDKS
jgi:hypothetical protein